MKKIKVLYDSQVFLMQRFGGISRYFTFLLTNMVRVEPSIVIPYSDNVYLDKTGYKKKDLPSFPVGKRTIALFINQCFTICELLLGRLDLFHPTMDHTYFLPFLRKPLVITIHDMIIETVLPDKEHYAGKIRKRKKLIKKSDRIIAVSHYTKDAILSVYPETDPEKIRVIHHGLLIDPGVIPDKESIIEGEYLLYIGYRHGYKNFTRMLRAISGILNEKNMYLVCTGVPLNEEEEKLAEMLHVKKRLIVKNGDDRLMAALYRHAKVFMFPSLSEGFGLPILEAFQFGAPVCLSRSSCFPEIAGDAAVYFDPEDELDVRNKVLELIDNENLRQLNIEKGKQRLSLFSVDKMVMETEQLYLSLFK